MSQHASGEIRRPRTDDRPLRDIAFGIWGYPAVLVAHDLKLFPLRAERPRTLSEVCEALKIARRPAEAILTVCTSLGLVQLQGDRYSLTPLSTASNVCRSNVMFTKRRGKLHEKENGMAKIVARMTTDELREMIETSIEQKLLEILGDPDAGLKVRKAVRDRLLRQKKAVAAGERGEPFEDVVQRLGLE